MGLKNILYAEDNPDDLFMLKIAFKRAKMPHALHSIEDGEGAISWLNGDGDFKNREKHPLPDVLVLDLKMPKKSGFDVLEWLKNSGQLEKMPVVVLSSSDDPKDIKRATELGAVKYIMKSATCKDIIAYLASLD